MLIVKYLLEMVLLDLQIISTIISTMTNKFFFHYGANLLSVDIVLLQ